MQILDTASYLGSNVNSVFGNGLWLSVTEYTQDQISNQTLHAHVNPHLTVLLAGGTREERDNAKYVRVAGDTVFFSAGEPHQNTNTLIGSKNFNLEFTDEFFKKFDLSEADLNNAVVRGPDVTFTLLKAYKEYKLTSDSSTDAITMAVLSLMSGRSGVTKGVPAWVTLVEEIMQDRWNEQITLQELSDVTGIHPVTISKQFPRYFSCTFLEYMRILKSKHALILIKNSRHSLTRIAHECGFVDQSHFGRSFKILTGFLPKEFRKL